MVVILVAIQRRHHSTFHHSSFYFDFLAVRSVTPHVTAVAANSARARAREREREREGGESQTDAEKPLFSPSPSSSSSSSFPNFLSSKSVVTAAAAKTWVAVVSSFPLRKEMA